MILALDAIATCLAAERLGLRRGRGKPPKRRGTRGLVDDEAGNSGCCIMKVDGVALANLLDICVQRQNVKTHQGVYLDPHRDSVRRARRPRNQSKCGEQRGAKPA